jgi:hypothetical protein|tara:strand:+ start:521 stop:814 length:294 start_codon:yes stop_codon:yes gene_type:complete
MENLTTISSDKKTPENNMDFYMYKYSCPSWIGTYKNINHLVVSPQTSENDVKTLARNISNKSTGSQNCKIDLLQKYKMIILAEKCYPSIPNMTFNKH